MLLAGVNDCVHIQRALVHKLVANRIRPYYLYQCDLVEGSGHFRTPVGKGLEIIEGLRGHTSGYAVPTYVIDAPGGGGKIPVMPNYLISYSDHKVVLRNYEGYITTYEEPETYRRHDQATCAYCQHERPEPGQSGVLGLLEGERMWIEPKGFEEIHSRGNTEAHRLQDPSKWVPYGVGAIEGQAAGPPVTRAAADGEEPRPSRRGGRQRLRSRRGAASARGRADRVGPRGAALGPHRTSQDPTQPHTAGGRLVGSAVLAHRGGRSAQSDLTKSGWSGRIRDGPRTHRPSRARPMANAHRRTRCELMCRAPRRRSVPDFASDGVPWERNCSHAQDHFIALRHRCGVGSRRRCDRRLLQRHHHPGQLHVHDRQCRPEAWLLRRC